MCGPLPPSAPPSAPSPKANCRDLSDVDKACKIKVKKCQKKPPKMKKCEKKCEKDGKKESPLCQKTCCTLGV